MNKKVLIITYYWPPAGGPGVQRILKFVKYLPQFGWDPIILTVKKGEYPALDYSLENDIPFNCKVYKTKSLDPSFLYRKFTRMEINEKIPVANLAKKDTNWKKKVSKLIRLNFFIPDAKIGWIRYAIKEGKKIIQKENPNIIFSTSPPPTTHLIAKKLAKWSKIKWVADFRDPWRKIHYYHGQKINLISRTINKNLEKNVIADCDKAICVSKNFVSLLTEEKIDKFKIIPNGFDLEPVPYAKKNNDLFTILYIGGLTWNRYYPLFFRVLTNMFKANELNPEKVQLQIVGSIEPSILTELKTIFFQFKNVYFSGYIPHNDALELMQNADLLLLFLEKVEGYEGHVPGKLFEYVSTGNFIIGIGNKDGESAQILKDTGCGKFIDPTNEDKMKREILVQFRNWEKGISPEINREIINSFSRNKLTKELADLFDELL